MNVFVKHIYYLFYGNNYLHMDFDYANNDLSQKSCVKNSFDEIIMLLFLCPVTKISYPLSVHKCIFVDLQYNIIVDKQFLKAHHCIVIAW